MIVKKERSETALALMRMVDNLALEQGGLPVSISATLAGASGADFNVRKAGINALLELELLALTSGNVEITPNGRSFMAQAQEDGEITHSERFGSVLRSIEKDSRFNPPPMSPSGVLASEPAALEALLNPANHLAFASDQSKTRNRWMGALLIVLLLAGFISFNAWLK